MTAGSEKLPDQAQRLRRLRKLAHKTQEEAAHGIGVALGTYQNWERGGGMRLSSLRRVADYFGSTPRWIEYGDHQTEIPGATGIPAATALEDRLTALENAIDDLKEMAETQLKASGQRLETTRPILEAALERLKALTDSASQTQSTDGASVSDRHKL